MSFRRWITDLRCQKLLRLLAFIPAVLITLSCAEKNPPREEIPAIKDFLGKFQQAVKEQNPAVMDSLIAFEALDLGYSSGSILSNVYGWPDEGSFYAFGRRSFFYTKDRAVVNCFIMADSADTGRPVKMTLVKKGDQWLLKRFELQ